MCAPAAAAQDPGVLDSNTRRCLHLIVFDVCEDPDPDVPTAVVPEAPGSPAPVPEPGALDTVADGTQLGDDAASVSTCTVLGAGRGTVTKGDESCAGSSGTVYYVTPRRMDQGEYFPGSYGWRVENWMRITNCHGGGCGGRAHMNDHNNRLIGSTDAKAGCPDEPCWIGRSFPRMKGTPLCSVPPSQFRGYVDEGSCHYVYKN